MNTKNNTYEKQNRINSFSGLRARMHTDSVRIRNINANCLAAQARRSCYTTLVSLDALESRGARHYGRCARFAEPRFGADPRAADSSLDGSKQRRRCVEVIVQPVGRRQRRGGLCRPVTNYVPNHSTGYDYCRAGGPGHSGQRSFSGPHSGLFQKRHLRL